MSVSILPTTTAGTHPEEFASQFFPNRKLLIALLTLCLLAGFALRTQNLGAESLSEDELNKLQTVAEYRENGLSGRNGEHPFLMKGLQTASITISEKLNDSIFSATPDWRISDEAALRFPTTLFGTFTALLIFLLVSELFGSSIGLIAAALWSFDPTAIGFDRIAKEDSFLLFFFLLTNIFWLKSQSGAEREEAGWHRYAWLAGAAFGGLMASKYLPHLLAISAAYNKVFQLIPGVKWKFNRYAWLKFLIIAGVSFLILNPTILLPDTWREMLTFSGEKRIGHDSYEFMGELYRNQMSLWLKGVPWTFYYVFIFVKTPLLTLIAFLAGLTVIFRKRMGDGRFFIFFWMFMWFMPFTVLGGKFTRYFTVAEPLVLITAAVGCYFTGRWLARKLFSAGSLLQNYFSWALPMVLVIASIFASLSASPHFRLFTNTLGGGQSQAGNYFPHDEFYDAGSRETAEKIAVLAAGRQAVVASETPTLFDYYFSKAGRGDLITVSLSDTSKTANLSDGDFIIAAKGRRYFSNDEVLKYLEGSVAPVDEVKFGETSAVKIYRLDEASAEKIRELARK